MLLFLISLIPLVLIINNLYYKYRSINKNTKLDITEDYCNLKLRQKYRC